MSTVIVESHRDEWKEKYDALADAIAGALGQKVLTSLITVAERNRTQGRPY